MNEPVEIQNYIRVEILHHVRCEFTTSLFILRNEVYVVFF
jgi:hypothetical protein